MSRSGGLISRVFRALVASGSKESRCVGQDHLGNRYFEKDPGKNRRGARWVESPGQEDPTFIPEVPSEWDAWLRKRRDNPPNQEELDRNFAMMIRTQQRAKELEEKEKLDQLPASSTEQTYTETVTQDSFQSKFPKYDDFEISPGQFKSKAQDDKQ